MPINPIQFVDNAAPLQFTAQQSVSTVDNSERYTVVTRNTVVPATLYNKYVVISTAAITLFLPAFPVNGATVVISDGGNFASFNCTVKGNGRTIAADTADLVIDAAGVRVELVYFNGDWKTFYA